MFPTLSPKRSQLYIIRCSQPMSLYVPYSMYLNVFFPVIPNVPYDMSQTFPSLCLNVLYHMSLMFPNPMFLMFPNPMFLMFPNHMSLMFRTICPKCSLPNVPIVSKQFSQNSKIDIILLPYKLLCEEIY